MKYCISIILSALLVFIACDEDDKFKDEMYKNIFCLVSGDDNVYANIHSFKDEVSGGIVSIYCGGSNPIGKDVTIELEYDDEIINTYNYKYYDLDYDRYAKQLPSSKYEIASLVAAMKGGQEDPYVTIDIKMYTAGISPDSVYFIPLRIKSISGGYEYNEDMRSILYRPLVENDFAQTKVATSYSMRGNRGTTEVVATKTMYPLSANQSRITVDTQTGLVDNIANLDKINQYAIILTVSEDNLVTISPYGTIQVEQLGDPSDNRYEVTDFKRFYLYYCYRTLVTPATEISDAVYSSWVTIKETLKRQN